MFQIAKNIRMDNKQEKLASFFFSLIGIGYLFPFSAMSQPADYWEILFPSFNILFYISAVFMYTNLLLLAALVFLTTENTTRSFIIRIYIGFFGQLLALIIVPSSYFLGFDETENTWVILGSTAFMALVTAFLDSSVIALAGCFSLKCQESLQLGVGLSTLIGCVYRVITKVAFPATRDGTVVSSLIYFYTGSLTIVGCIACFYFLLRLPLSQERLQMVGDKPISEHGPLLVEEGSSETDGLLGKYIPIQDDGDDSNNQTLVEDGTFSKYDAWRKSLMNGLCISFLFLTTLAVWPALVTEIPTYQFPFLEKGSWWSLSLLSLFAFMDVVGRFTVSLRFGVTRHNIWIPVFLRILFIPFVVMCVKGILFTHDAWPILFMIILGWSNGWCGSLTIILMNECGDSDLEKRYIGTLASFYLNGGLVVGSTVGLLVEKLVLY